VAHLTLVLQGREVRKFVLNPTVTTIGRAQDNDIVINNLALSRRHAQVERRNGRYEVSDLQSQNGVYVNSERVRGARVLQNTDTITLGTYHFVFNDQEQSDPDVRSVRPKRAQQEVTELGDKPKAPEPAKAPEPEAEPHVPLLVLKYNDVELQRFPLKNQVCVIGRAKDCDVQIAERRLSRKHCEIIREADRYTVKDLGSQNGTYVNRRRIRDLHLLQDGDVLNFAEYSVLFLADPAAYNGPDLVHARRQAAKDRGHGGPGPRPASSIAAEETEFPEAYDSPDDFNSSAASIIPDEDQVHPVDLEDPEVSQDRKPPMSMMPDNRRRDPFIEGPKESRERRQHRNDEPKRVIRERAAPGRHEDPKEEIRDVARKTLSKEPGFVPKKATRAEPPARLRRDEIADVPDEVGDMLPDSSLDDWYKAREEKSEVFEEEDSSVLLRGKSSVSQILSTMMVDKKELDRNLSMKARQRKFFIDVRRGDERIYSGPLTQPVTILGTDREADIQLKGRYVAGRHSILVRVRDSLLLVRLGSSSAARVNGLPKLQAFLKTGDVIQIDETTIRITED
jgi:pSer/pThr/pTyr-binding forkhead associated (FHA) protein